MAEIARIGVYGDLHLCSKDYGAHRDYPKESLEYLSKITEITRDRKLTHLIGCGDFTFGRFNTLEYRMGVEKQLEEQYKLVKGNHYELFGNHDKAGYGLTERDFYIQKGLLKPSQNLTIENLHITMVDYGKTMKTEPNIVDDNDHINFIIAHDFYKFKDTQIANFGKAIELDNLDRWYGADYLICGHIHKIMGFSGSIIKGNRSHELLVHYLGCMMRPAYREGYIDEKGQVLVLILHDDGRLDYDIEDVQLWPISDSFNLEVKEKEKTKKEEKVARVDISDIVKQLDSQDRSVGNPEEIIKDMSGIDIKYKNKAIQLLKDAMG